MSSLLSTQFQQASHGGADWSCFMPLRLRTRGVPVIVIVATSSRIVWGI